MDDQRARIPRDADGRRQRLRQASGALAPQSQPGVRPYVPAPPAAATHALLDAEPTLGPVVVSYASTDREVARELVAYLRQQRFAAWWDQDIRGGENFQHRIREMLELSGAAIVIWSRESSQSEFVIDEARAAKRLSKLITTRLPGLSDAEIPYGFGTLRCESVLDREHIVQSLAGLGIRRQAGA